MAPSTACAVLYRAGRYRRDRRRRAGREVVRCGRCRPGELALTDNGGYYPAPPAASRRRTAWGVGLRRTRPYRPQTTAAGAFIKILQADWA